MWHKVSSLETLQQSKFDVVVIDNIQIAVYLLDDGIYAFEDTCTHHTCPLAGGPVYDNQITCMMHGARFCMKTGQATQAPGFHPLRMFRCRAVEGVVEVEV